MSTQPGVPAQQPGAPSVVAFGGGHGLAASLAALRQVTPHLTAVVTVADDGGSSGRVRQELDVVPPGDLRMALAALSGTDAWSTTWTGLFQHRFAGDGPLGGHAVGNLVLAALVDRLGDPVAALDLCLRLLGGSGRVLPLSEHPVDIVADVDDPLATGGRAEVRGQAAVASTRGVVTAVRLVPAEPVACPAALAAVAAADAVVLGPGSLFTSVLPHLLVPQMRSALRRTTATRVLVLNLAPQPGETTGFSPEAHLEVLARDVPDVPLDVVVADRDAVPDPARLAEVARRLGARLHLAAVAVPGEHRHDPDALAAALRTCMASTRQRT